MYHKLVYVSPPRKAMVYWTENTVDMFVKNLEVVDGPDRSRVFRT